MTEQNPNPVLVAVGHDPIDVALAFAAGEAARAGCGLHLVHVVHLIVHGAETVLVEETDLERAGRLALNAALERARDLVPAGVPVTAEQRIGGVVPTLVEMANDARMIVLERRDLSSLLRVVTRSVSSGVAAHARVPVVSVPAQWAPVGRAGEVPLVTVGVDVPERSERVLRAGVDAARSRGAVLRVLHMWPFPAAYDDLSSIKSEEWTARATAEIRSAIDALGDDIEQLPVQIEARDARAGDALVQASLQSDLLVIGRHDSLMPIGSHLGPVARAVLREAECPVLLVDPRPARGWKRRSETATIASAQPV